MLRFIKKYSWIILLVFMLLLFPQSLSDQAKLNMRVIITGVGIDYINGQYQITSQIVLPQNGTESGGISAHINYISADAKTIGEGVQKVSYKLGKLAELSHIEFILVGETMKDHNLASCLDYFFRNFKLKKSVMLIACMGQAKEAILKTEQLELGVALSLQKIYLSNQNSLNGVEKSYVDFINDTYSTSGCSVLDTFVIDSPQENESQSNSNDQTSQASSSSSGQESAKLKSKTPLLLFKHGKFVDKMVNEDNVLGYYLTLPKAKTGNIYLQNFSYGDIQNANINIRIDNMNKHNKISFEDSKIIHTININLTDIKLDEIAPINATNINQYKQLPKSTQDQILNTLKEKISSLITSTFQYCQQQNFDIFNTANFCNKYHNNKWNTFVSQLENPSNYINHVNVVVNVNFDKIG